eukprot:TRINITY_DN3164_c0_g1_i5.p1 TRINITY_DN3164_c0_g1~~TRINITY_DN3164_c0_g1_i5.p1  ORF type:complete len:112 (+),score=26.05 TRINITY_DN3164_c0_g1_i5:148-483(+)
MCVECVKSVTPDRGTTCLDTGAYMMNFKGCKVCNEKQVKTTSLTREEDESGKEEVTFIHVCSKCSHEVSKHSYSFEIDGEFQEESMDCLLCGYGERSTSIDPYDPRENKLF